LTKTDKDTEPEIIIRDMQEVDIKQVAELEKEFFSDPWPVSAFQEIIEETYWRASVALSNDIIIGYACYYIVDIEAHLANIAVAPAYRRKSVAKRLLEIILQYASASDCEYILLEVRPSSKAARSFYDKHGFELLYRRPGYYHNPDEDALVMIRYLRNKTE